MCSWFCREAHGLRQHLRFAGFADYDFDATEERAWRCGHTRRRHKAAACLLYGARQRGAGLRLLGLQANLGQRVVRHPARKRAITQNALIGGGHQCSARCRNQPGGENRRRNEDFDQAEA